MTDKKQGIACFHWSFRYSLPIVDRSEPGIENFKNHGDLMQEVFMKLKYKFIFQLELTGEDNWHYQGWIHVPIKMRKTALLKSVRDFPGTELSEASVAGKEALKTYCMKEDTRKGGPWSDQPGLYVGQDNIVKLYPWQQSILDLLLLKPDGRTLMWVYDPIGHNGKSEFIKHLGWKYKFLGMSYADAKDMLHVVSNNMGRKCYTFDLPRTVPRLLSSNDIYTAMEMIKNGYFISPKYQGKEVFIPHPHILACSNSLPDLNKVTKDRWAIYTILPDRTLSKMNMTEVWAIINAATAKKKKMALSAGGNDNNNHTILGQYDDDEQLIDPAREY